MVCEKKVSKVIVAYEVWFRNLEQNFSSFWYDNEVIDRESRSSREELVEDLITIVSHFAGKLYGLRSHKYKEVVEGVRKLVG